jgi:hypothetical protein
MSHFDTDQPQEPFEPVTRLLDCERTDIGRECVKTRGCGLFNR